MNLSDALRRRTNAVHVAGISERFLGPALHWKRAHEGAYPAWSQMVCSTFQSTCIYAIGYFRSRRVLQHRPYASWLAIRPTAILAAWRTLSVKTGTDSKAGYSAMPLLLLLNAPHEDERAAAVFYVPYTLKKGVVACGSSTTLPYVI
eukprot:4102894-Pleurochrysis_carterae.AAC.1